MLSFEATKDGVDIEADLGLLLRESRYGVSSTELVFAECKSFGDFERRDVQRARLLAQEFPGAVLVFASLKDGLSEKEKRLLRPLVNQGRRYWRDERPFNPVLILTGTELFARDDPPRCWGQKSKYIEPVMPLLRLCDLTQQRYLDMKPWHDWLEERWEKRRSKRRTKD